TQRALEIRIAELDGAAHCVVFPSGQAAICSTLLALLKKGDHLLMTDAAYGLAKSFAVERLQALGVEVEFYRPRIGADIERLIRRTTRLIWLESPGTVTMELEDVPAIAAIA
ncbi:cystathionine beta-lyase, partial [Massilia sp. JS1662]